MAPRIAFWANRHKNINIGYVVTYLKAKKCNGELIKTCPLNALCFAAHAHAQKLGLQEATIFQLSHRLKTTTKMGSRFENENDGLPVTTKRPCVQCTFSSRALLWK